jgi:hypothetical protein
MDMQMCKTCGVEHPLEAFETYKVNGVTKYRLECMEARKARRRKAEEEALPVNREEVPLPESCNKCGLKAPDVTFSWKKGVPGGWRTICTACRALRPDGRTHSQVSREREMERDPEGVRAHRAATMRAWLAAKRQ